MKLCQFAHHLHNVAHRMILMTNQLKKTRKRKRMAHLKDTHGLPKPQVVQLVVPVVVSLVEQEAGHGR